jgi:hypothetical protein
MIKTGERTYCIIVRVVGHGCNGQCAAADDRLDAFRDTFEDLGGGLGVTDPVAGAVVLALK